MWKQRKLEMEAEDKKTDRRTDKRRKENAPSQKSEEYVSGYWNKKLMELKEKDTSRWGHSGYKELYPEEFTTEPAKKTSTKQGRQSKKRHHDSSDSDSVDVSSRRRHVEESCKESVNEKHKKHKKSKQKDTSHIIRKDRVKSSRSRSNSPKVVRKPVKDKSSHESKKLSTEKYKRDSLTQDIREKSHDSDPERVVGKGGRSRKRQKASPPVERNSPKKPGKKGDHTAQDKSLSSRAAEIRREIEELENSVDKKKSKKSQERSPCENEKSEEVVVEVKNKKHKKKKQSSNDKVKDRLLDDDGESRVQHKTSEQPRIEPKVIEPKSHERRHKSAREVNADREESKRKKSSKSRQCESLPERTSDQKESEKKPSRLKETEGKSEKKGNSSKTSSYSQDIDDDAEKLRELAKKSMRNRSSRTSAVKEHDGDTISVQNSDKKDRSSRISAVKEDDGDTISVQKSEKKDAESKNGYKRLKFKKEENPVKDRSVSSSPEKSVSPSPKRRNSPSLEQRKLSPKHGRSSTKSSRLVSDPKVSKALEDVRDPMDDFPESPSDNASVSEGEIVRTKEKKSHKKNKKSKKKKEKKKKKSSRSKGEDKPPEEFSLEVSDNFGLCDSVMAFDGIGDLD
ncbi:hypothetical protein ACHWQZ_G018646 [Mnemiopsis leidyi]